MLKKTLIPSWSNLLECIPTLPLVFWLLLQSFVSSWRPVSSSSCAHNHNQITSHLSKFTPPTLLFLSVNSSPCSNWIFLILKKNTRVLSLPLNLFLDQASYKSYLENLQHRGIFESFYYSLLPFFTSNLSFIYSYMAFTSISKT